MHVNACGTQNLVILQSHCTVHCLKLSNILIRKEHVDNETTYNRCEVQQIEQFYINKTEMNEFNIED